MSAIFDAARFGRLFRSHWSENHRAYAWFAGIAAMVDLVVIALVFIVSRDQRYDAFKFDSQIVWFFTGVFVTGVVFSTRYGGGLSNAGAALVTLMRPASHFEKWLLAFLWVAVLFPLAYTALYSLIHWPVVQVAHWLHVLPPIEMRRYDPDPNFDFYVPLLTQDASLTHAPGKKDFFAGQLLMLLLLSAVQAYCVGCKYFFKKAATLKMAILGFVLFLAIVGLSSVFDIDFFLASRYWMMRETEAGWQPLLLDQVIATALLIGVPALLWASVYFHLQEREVS